MRPYKKLASSLSFFFLPFFLSSSSSLFSFPPFLLPLPPPSIVVIIVMSGALPPPDDAAGGRASKRERPAMTVSFACQRCGANYNGHDMERSIYAPPNAEVFNRFTHCGDCISMGFGEVVETREMSMRSQVYAAQSLVSLPRPVPTSPVIIRAAQLTSPSLFPLHLSRRLRESATVAARR